MVSFSRVLQELKCPVTGCLAVAHSVGRHREHFMYCHFRSKEAVFQEGEEPLPCRDLCGMHMPAGWLIKHQRTAQCDKKTQMRWGRRDVAIVDKCSEEMLSLTGEE